MIIKDVLCPKTIQKMFIVMFNHLFDLTDHMVGVSWYNVSSSFSSYWSKKFRLNQFEKRMSLFRINLFYCPFSTFNKTIKKSKLHTSSCLEINVIKEQNSIKGVIKFIF